MDFSNLSLNDPLDSKMILIQDTEFPGVIFEDVSETYRNSDVSFRKIKQYLNFQQGESFLNLFAF